MQSKTQNTVKKVTIFTKRMYIYRLSNAVHTNFLQFTQILLKWHNFHDILSSHQKLVMNSKRMGF